MIKAQLIKAVAETTAQDIETTANVVNELFNQIKDTLVLGDVIYLEDFGTFKVYKLPERQTINRYTGKSMTLPTKKIPEFTPAKTLRLAVRDSSQDF